MEAFCREKGPVLVRTVGANGLEEGKVVLFAIQIYHIFNTMSRGETVIFHAFTVKKIKKYNLFCIL